MEIIGFIVLALVLYGLYKAMPEAEKKKPDIKEIFFKNRRLMLKNGGKNPYVDLFSDNEITDLYNIIEKEFTKAAQERNETISPNQRLYILYEIIFASGLNGKEFGMRHLEYELMRYKEKGIRPDNHGLIRWEF